MVVLLCGCGGSHGGSQARTVAFVGSVDSPVLSGLKAQFNNPFSSPDPTDADLLVLDGDSLSASHLTRGGVADRALSKGHVVLLLDAREEHTQALDRELGTHGSPKGKSLAYALYRYPLPGGRRGTRVLHLSTNPRRRTIHRKTVKSGSVIVGKAEQQEVDASGPTAIAAFTQQLAQEMDDPWTDPIAADVPSDMVWQSSSHLFMTDTPTGDVSLDGQVVMQAVNYVVRVFLSNAGADPSKYYHTVVYTTDGFFTTGQLAHQYTQLQGDFLVTGLGWLQTQGVVTTSIDRTAGDGPLFMGGTSGMQPGEDGYQYALDVAIPYQSGGVTQTWNYGFNSGWIPVPGFSAKWWTGATDPVASVFLTSPYNAIAGDIQSSVENNSLLQFPDAAQNQLPIQTIACFRSSSMAKDRMSLKLEFQTDYTDLNLLVPQVGGESQLKETEVMDKGAVTQIVSFRDVQPK